MRPPRLSRAARSQFTSDQFRDAHRARRRLKSAPRRVVKDPRWAEAARALEPLSRRHVAAPRNVAMARRVSATVPSRNAAVRGISFNDQRAPLSRDAREPRVARPTYPLSAHPPDAHPSRHFAGRTTSSCPTPKRTLSYRFGTPSSFATRLRGSRASSRESLRAALPLTPLDTPGRLDAPGWTPSATSATPRGVSSAPRTIARPRASPYHRHARGVRAEDARVSIRELRTADSVPPDRRRARASSAFASRPRKTSAPGYDETEPTPRAASHMARDRPRGDQSRAPEEAAELDPPRSARWNGGASAARRPPCVAATGIERRRECELQPRSPCSTLERATRPTIRPTRTPAGYWPSRGR